MTGGVGYSFGLFIKPMSAEFGWSRSLISSVFLVRTLTIALASPLFGPLLDRKEGARLIMALGGAVAALGLALLALTPSLPFFFLSYGVLAGLGTFALGTELVTSTLVSKWFVRRRGRALAVAAMGTSLGGAALVPVTNLLIGAFDWRGAWVGLAVLMFLGTVPVSALLVRRQPEDMGLSPDGACSGAHQASLEPALSPGQQTERAWTIKEAARQPTLWVIIACFSLSTLTFGGLFVHFIPYITDKGYSPSLASAVITVLGLTAGLVKPAWGLLAERVPVRYAVAACFVITASSLGALILTTRGPIIFLFPVLYALGAGGLLPLTGLIWANYFGRHFLGAIRGVFTPVTLIANGVAPLFAAFIYDTTRSYDLAYLVGIGALLLGAIGILFARPPSAH